MTAFRRLCAATILIASTTLFAQTAPGFGVQIPWRFLIGAEKPVADYNAPPLPADFHSRSPDQNEQAPTSAPSAEIDLSPRFASRLPYSVALGRVVIESNFPLESAQGLEAEIVQLQNDLVGFLGVPEAQEKISLCLFNDIECYRAFIAETFRGAPTDLPASMKDSARRAHGPEKRPDAAQYPARNDARVPERGARNVPIWIDEGLAKYFEIPPGERGFRNPYLTDAEQGAGSLARPRPCSARTAHAGRSDEDARVSGILVLGPLHDPLFSADAAAARGVLAFPLSGSAEGRYDAGGVQAAEETAPDADARGTSAELQKRVRRTL